MAGVLTHNEKAEVVDGHHRRDLLPLGLLSTGEVATVVEIVAGRYMGIRIEDMGVREGKVVEVLNNEGHSPLLIKVNDSRIAMGRGMAMKIMVRRIS